MIEPSSLVKSLNETFDFDKVQGINIDISRYRCTAVITFINGDTVANHTIQAPDFLAVVEKVYGFLGGLKE